MHLLLYHDSAGDIIQPVFYSNCVTHSRPVATFKKRHKLFVLAKPKQMVRAKPTTTHREDIL